MSSDEIFPIYDQKSEKSKEKTENMVQNKKLSTTVITKTNMIKNIITDILNLKISKEEGEKMILKFLEE